jgi:16S rRNA processing protein RimM
MSSHTFTDPVRLGVIVGVRGIKGEVRIKSFTDEPTDIAAYGPLFDQSGKTQFDLRVTGTHKGVVLARIKGIDDRNSAEALKRPDLFVDRAQLPPPEVDEFYDSDLVGLQAETTTGKSLGRVKGLFDFGAGPVMEMDGNVMVPFTKAVVPEVDIANGKVVIDPPDGLFDPPEPEAQDDQDDEEETT